MLILNKPQNMIQVAAPCMDDREWQALKAPLESGWLTQGPQVAAFEKAFAGRHKVKYACATTNCTTALHISLLAVGVKPGDAVVVPSFTWVSTANAVEYCGAKPLFCDIDPHTYNLDPQSLTDTIGKAQNEGQKVKAVIPVHLFGLCADMDAIMKIANNNNLKVVEDAACASGAAYKDQPAGSIGDIGCFSFHPRKVLVTGEGGMCTTNSSDLAEILNCLRNHGASISEEQRHHNNAPYLMADFEQLGYNYRLSDLQGAVGLVQLDKLDDFIAERERWAAYYDRELGNISWLQLPSRPKGSKISWQAYVCRVKKESPLTRDQLLEKLHLEGISSRVGTQAVHLLGYYQNKYKLQRDDLPVSRDAYSDTIALPLHNAMRDEDYAYVAQTLKQI